MMNIKITFGNIGIRYININLWIADKNFIFYTQILACEIITIYHYYKIRYNFFDRKIIFI